MSEEGSRAQYELVLLQERSAGTFARVYLAEARSRGGIDRIVAVKVLKDQWSDNDEMMVRTRDEARLLARLHHKNILRVEAMTRIQGQLAIVMEFVDGLDLKQLIEAMARRGRPAPPRTAYRIVADAASALHAAYYKVPYGKQAPLQVVHRDLKPSNIMVSTQGEVKVLDFGTARFTSDARVARTGVLRFGSMKYMSPERRLGDRGDHASDVYALGLLLLEMLRGRELPLLPLDPSEHDADLEQVIAEIPDHGLPNEEWAESLRQTLRCMCAPDPSARLDAGQALELLRAFADQAAGESLDAFAASTIGPITREVYGDGSQGDLSGSRVFVGMGGEEAGAPRQLAPVGPGGLSPEAEQVTRPMPVSGGDAPTRQLARPAPAPAARPASDPSSPQPSAATAGSPPAASPVAAPVAPPTAAARGGGNAVVVGIVVGIIAFLGVAVLGLAGVGWWLWTSTPGPSPTRTASAEPAPEPAAPAPAAASSRTHRVTVGASDTTIRWIRVEDDGGDRVLNGRPDGEADLAAGAYVLKVKVAGREVAAAPLEVTGDLALSCSPVDKGRVRCEGAEAGAIVLRP